MSKKGSLSSVPSTGTTRRTITVGGRQDDPMGPADIFGERLSYCDQICLINRDVVPGFVFCRNSSTPYSIVTVKPGGTASNPKLGNIRDGVFEILPQNKYKQRKRFLNLKQSNNASPTDVEDAEEAAKAEDVDNETERALWRGRELHYGEVVMLRHLSGKYLRMSSTRTSHSEPSNMKVDMCNHPDRHSWFRFMPRYKVRAEGDPVRIGDQVILESVMTAGQFLHVSRRALTKEDSTEAGMHELNLSVINSSFEVFLHKSQRDMLQGQAQYSNQGTQHSLTGGSVVQMHHKEEEAYLSAEGSCISHKPTLDAHLRLRLPDPQRPHRLLPPTTAVTFWQIENAVNPAKGSILFYSDAIRVRHVITQSYLTVTTRPDGTHRISLTPHQDNDTVFRLEPIISEGDMVQSDTYCRIMHVRTEHYISKAERHAVRHGRRVPESELFSQGLVDRTQAIQWDHAPLWELTLASDSRLEDAFIFLPVPEASLQDLSIVMGMIAPMLYYIEKERPADDLRPQEARHIIAALDELKRFIEASEGDQRRIRQKLLRNTQVVDLLIHLIKSPFREYGEALPSSDPDALDEQHEDEEFGGASGFGFASRKMSLNDLERFPATRRVVEAAYEVLRMFLRGDSRKNELYMAIHVPFFHSQVGRKINVESMYAELIRDNDRLIRTLSETEIHDIVTLLRKEKKFDYLEILEVLCVSNGGPLPTNQKRVASVLLDKYRDTVYHTRVSDGKMQLSTSSANGPWRSMDDFASAATKQGITSQIGLEYEFLEKQLKLFGLLCLGRNQYCINLITKELGHLTIEEALHSLTLSKHPGLLAVYVQLIKTMFVDVDPNRDVLEDFPLNYNWNGLQPRPYLEQAEKETIALTGAEMPYFPRLYEWTASFLKRSAAHPPENEDENDLMAATLSLLYDLICFGYLIAPQHTRQILKLLVAIVKANTSKAKHAVEIGSTAGTGRPISEAVARAKLQALRCIDVLMNLSDTTLLQVLLYDFKQVMMSNFQASSSRRPTFLRRTTISPVKGSHGGRDVEVLHRLMELPSSTLEEDIYELSTEVRQYVHSLFDEFDDTTPKWHPGDMKTTGLVEDLLAISEYDDPSLVHRSTALLHRLYSSRHDLFSQGIQAQVLINKGSIALQQKLSEDVPTLRRLAKGFIEEGERSEYTRIVGSLIPFCVKDPSSSSSPPHPVNQGLLVNAGVLNVLLDVVSRDEQLADVLALSFRLLRSLAAGYEHVQKAIFLSLFTIMQTRRTGESGYENDMLEMIAEVFTNNQALCLSVQSDHVELIMKILEQHVDKVPGALLALRAVTKAEELDIALKRNQAMIIKFIMERRDTVVSVAHIDDESDAAVNAARMQLISSRNPENTLRRYHKELVLLLAACAEGENKYIESMCQTIFSIPELLEVIQHPKVPWDVKDAYMRFLLWVYINTGEASQALAEAKLDVNTTFWNSLADSFSMVTSWVQKPALSAPEADFIFEALVPLTTAMFEHFYPSEPSVLDQCVFPLASNVLSFAQAALKKTPNGHALQRLSRCAIKVATRTGRRHDQLFQDLESMNATDAGQMISPIEQKYEVEYGQENRLNQAFNMLSKRLLKAYNGMNDKHVQLNPSSHFAAKPHDDEPEEYCEGKAEDERLPLGPDFQAEVHLLLEDATSFRISRFKRLMYQLQVSRDGSADLTARDRLFLSQIDARTLQLVRAAMHNAAITGHGIEPLQDVLKDDIVAIAYSLSNSDDEVVRECLALLVKMLENGHKGMQQSLAEYFLGTREEVFFKVIQGRIRRSIEATREKRELRRQVKRSGQTAETLRGSLTALSSLGRRVDGLQQLTASSNTSPEDPNDIELDLLGATDVEESREQKIARALAETDAGNIELVLRVMQNMCEGQNQELKHYLRTQPDNIHDFDLVSQTVLFLEALLEGIDDSPNLSLIVQAFETLVEVAQGLPENQRAILSNRIIDHVNLILRTPLWKRVRRPAGEEKSHKAVDALTEPLDAEEVVALHAACAKIFIAMTEDNSVNARKIAEQMDDMLDLRAVAKLIKRYYKLHEDENEFWLDEDKEEDELAALHVGFLFYNVLLRIRDLIGKDYIRDPRQAHIWSDQILVQPMSQLRKIETPEAVEYFSKHVARVEILRDNNLENIYFLNKWATDITSDLKEKIQRFVDRETPQGKIRSFIDMASDVVEEQARKEAVAKHLGPLRYLAHHYSWIAKGMLALTFALQIVVFLTWRAPVNYYSTLPTIEDDWFDPALLGLGVLHLIVCVALFVSFFQNHPPVLLGTGSRFGTSNVFGSEYFHHILLIVMSALGLIFDGYFYAYHFFHIVYNNDILQRVVQAITKNGKSLLWVALLLVLVIYVYSLIIFAFLRRVVPYDDGAWCDTLWQCFVTSVRLGLMSGGGLGEALSPELNEWPTFFGRVIFDLSFFVIVTIVGLNVVFGIIVDTFSELREEKNQIDEAIRSECLICSLKSNDLDRLGKGYQYHIEQEHNPWSYLAFIWHLKKKDPNEFTSHEYYVMQLLNDATHNYEFFPINRTMSIESTAEAEEEIKERLEKLQQQIELLTSRQLDMMVQLRK